MSGLLIGYARVSTDAQDLTAQRDALGARGVLGERLYVDQGLTGTSRDRPGLREALAACRADDTLVVTKLDRLARSLPDARNIVDDLTRHHVRLTIGGSVHDPSDPVGHCCSTCRARTREGMQAAKARGRLRGKPKARGRLRGKQPKLTACQEDHLVDLHRTGQHTSAELAELFGVARSTVYRALERAQLDAPAPDAA